MTSLLSFNIDLVVTGIAAAGMCVLGFTAFISNTRSATHLSFFLFSIAGTVWSLLNYAFYHIGDPDIAFIIMRVVIFTAVWFVLFLFQFLFVYPKTEVPPARWYRFLVVPATAAVSIVTLTPFVFERIAAVGPDGTILQIQNGSGIYLFAGTVTLLIVSGLARFIQKVVREPRQSRPLYLWVLGGLSITFFLIVTFNMVLPAFFGQSQFIKYSALFILPTILGAAYSVRVHHLFNIKVFSTASLVFLLAIVTFGEIIFADTLPLVLFRSSTFIFVLVFGISLIRGVVREIEQRERIQRLAVELENSNEQLSEFMSLATHEIRNPATFIKGFTAGALEGDLGELSPEIKSGMQKLYVRANDIIHLGNQYLNKSKLELNQITFEYVATDIRKLVDDLVREFEPAAVQQGLTIRVVAEPQQDYTVEADAGKIKEVFANLIDNAIKYTPKGSITVTVAKTDTGVKVQIADTGVGIPDDVIPKLFKKFSRADAQKANILGTGLGLYLAKIFIDTHHGSIHIESTGKDKGTTFTVELPTIQPAEAAKKEAS